MHWAVSRGCDVVGMIDRIHQKCFGAGDLARAIRRGLGRILTSRPLLALVKSIANRSAERVALQMFPYCTGSILITRWLQVALAWLLARSPNILLIPGTSNPAHLVQNLAAAALDITNSIKAELDAIIGFK